MQNRLRTNRERIEQNLAHSPQRRYLSAAFLAQYQAVTPLINLYLRGDVIDIGCGTMPFKGMIRDTVTAYHTLDLWPCSENTTYVGDIQDMHMIEDASYDTALCFEVLEHVPDPGRAVHEMYRILRPGGFAIISVPHLSRLHDEPHDYYRFTKYGLLYLLEGAGFVVMDIQEKGGLFSFLGHQASTLLLAALWPVPGLRQLAWFLNKWFLTWPCYSLDRVSNQSGIFALGYVSIVQKPGCVT